MTVYEEVGKVQAGQDLVSVGGIPGCPLLMLCPRAARGPRGIGLEVSVTLGCVL